MGISAETRYVQQLHDWEDDRVKWLGWFGEKGMEYSGAIDKIHEAEQNLARDERLRDELVKILHEDDVKGHKKAVEAIKEHVTWENVLAKPFHAQLAFYEHVAPLMRDILPLEHERLENMMRFVPATKEMEAETRHLTRASYAYIAALQDMRGLLHAVTHAEDQNAKAIAQDKRAAIEGITAQFAGLVGGTKAAAAIQGVWDVGKSIECYAKFIESGYTDWPQMLAGGQYDLAAAEMFKIAGGGHRRSGAGGGGSGGRGIGSGGGRGSDRDRNHADWPPPQTLASGAAGGGRFGSIGSGIIVVHGSTDLHQMVAGLVNGAVERGITVTATNSQRGSPVGH
jgi:hypothetical protein